VEHTLKDVFKCTSLSCVFIIGCLRDPANVQQTSSKCIQHTGELLEVCWTFAAICYNGAGRLLDRVNTPLAITVIA